MAEAITSVMVLGTLAKCGIGYLIRPENDIGNYLGPHTTIPTNPCSNPFPCNFVCSFPFDSPDWGST